MVVLVIVIISVPHTWEMKKIWMLLYIFQEDFSFNDFFIIIIFLKKSSFFANSFFQFTGLLSSHSFIQF